MKHTILMLSLSMLIVFAAILGCDINKGPDPTVPAIDSIEIISVSPNSGLVDGQDYDFVVDVQYVLVSLSQGELQIGFNNGSSINSFIMITSADFVVNAGSGNHTFYVNTAVKDWGTSGDFQVYVNLSEYPHGTTWIPLANDRQALYF